eukprot:364804-Chlamydomonas_euryale.AAC.5
MPRWKRAPRWSAMSTRPRRWATTTCRSASRTTDSAVSEGWHRDWCSPQGRAPREWAYGRIWTTIAEVATRWHEATRQLQPAWRRGEGEGSPTCCRRCRRRCCQRPTFGEASIRDVCLASPTAAAGSRRQRLCS